MLRMMVIMAFSKVMGRMVLLVIQASRASLSCMAPKVMRKAEMKRISVMMVVSGFWILV